ncbi:tRNA uridine-5-carboxymethylaminomethyl(34) synthesis GTPase MnmE [Neorhizobium galegae]|uniref:tRNA uridine-5-carboxymethylaminomethyl(34) synthesis GTPase MnmE n=1 Tax=Neorhizobium galegae TaxID=399 RepID=UPI000620FC53|nr:tRNA uridine-5-carboxymethylaminomethyl(34) synthesis GTPase MnmE [Neorhizobium galegae]CDZ30003.1 TRNA modification GTPase MnmE [Neorhizobium galegae bv. officinalis]KAA9385283.1 tRNA uridine-5-carboxymethylaminomethyl(34) synthesis GTPase MnmE [Neorhizobium galegae]KAB1109773.1 tRNA uridine-5-carboxymethylaminomethyl(34) synthesis GTPase MnmE [Neorhizobium galegae]MCM2501840.1 tRNA uridine-5-carboxymethylaminomethyl(34) synthesis GTPase MnmE [Neorhizobium galegae]MCQ1771951.1 tRNA uridine
MIQAVNDTIYALSSGALPAGVAVVRISGSLAFDAARVLAGELPVGRKAALRTIRSRNGPIIDQALVLAFPGPNSFTGEDCVEMHLHGSRAVVSAVYRELELIGLRLAEAGEFSRRAFENGKLDLVEVEGLADLIASETEMQRRLAVEQGFGGQSALYMGWAERLTRARALIEAELDFADEDDVPGSVSDRVWTEVGDLYLELEEHIASAKAGEIIRDGYKVVIAGPPNAGKSSLLNALAKRDVAIVTEIAGTTRDILHVDVDMDGYLVRFFDTAGLRESEDRVEQEGVRRARIAIEQADLVLQLEEIDSGSKQILDKVDRDVLRVGTKADIRRPSPAYDLNISSETGEGLDELRFLILENLRQTWSGSLVPNRQRHLQYLKEASIFIEEALNGRELDLRAESLRAAASSLGRITGRVDVEQLLDVIFSQFCIGK